MTVFLDLAAAWCAQSWWSSIIVAWLATMGLQLAHNANSQKRRTSNDAPSPGCLLFPAAMLLVLSQSVETRTWIFEATWRVLLLPTMLCLTLVAWDSFLFSSQHYPFAARSKLLFPATITLSYLSFRAPILSLPEFADRLQASWPELFTLALMSIWPLHLLSSRLSANHRRYHGTFLLLGILATPLLAWLAISRSQGYRNVIASGVIWIVLAFTLRAAVIVYRQRQEKLAQREPCESDGRRRLEAKALNRLHPRNFRIKALEVLRGMSSRSQSPFYLQLLEDGDSHVVRQVLSDAKIVQLPDVLQAVRLLTMTTRDEEARLAAARCLVAVSDPAGLDALVDLATTAYRGGEALAELMKAGAAARSHLSRIARTGRNEQIRFAAASALHDYEQLAALTHTSDTNIRAGAWNILIEKLPDSTAAVEQRLHRRLDGPLLAALKQSGTDPIGALEAHPSVVAPVVARVCALAETARKDFARKFAKSSSEGSIGALLGYCQWVAEKGSPKVAPFLLAAELGETIVPHVLPLLESGTKAHRKLGLKILLVIRRKHSDPDRLHTLIDSRKSTLNPRGQLKVAELFRLWNTSSVPVSWDARSSTRAWKNWSW